MYMAEVLGTTDLHTIGVVGSIPSFATISQLFRTIKNVERQLEDSGDGH